LHIVTPLGFSITAIHELDSRQQRQTLSFERLRENSQKKVPTRGALSGDKLSIVEIRWRRKRAKTTRPFLKTTINFLSIPEGNIWNGFQRQTHMIENETETGMAK
jgi:hypothetical protein